MAPKNCLLALRHGINFRFFSPIRLFLPFNAGRRMHRKVCVVDGLRAITGGINISDKYRGTEKEKAWLDYAVYIEGPLCRDLELISEEVWTRRMRNLGTHIDGRKFIRSGGVMARITENDWLRRKNQISASYKQKLRTANDSIIIIASYFLPTRRLLKILLRAAMRGKKICIILSKHSDVPFIKPAMSYLYYRLLKNGIKIFEYEASILHAKAVVVDNRWTSIGSHNLNHLSEFISMEINIEILDKNFSESFSNELMLLTKHHCEEITLEEHERKRSVRQKLSEWFSYKIVSISQRILEALTRKAE
jgi:cardiolipin synthase A/B